MSEEVVLESSVHYPFVTQRWSGRYFAMSDIWRAFVLAAGAGGGYMPTSLPEVCPPDLQGLLAVLATAYETAERRQLEADQAAGGQSPKFGRVTLYWYNPYRVSVRWVTERTNTDIQCVFGSDEPHKRFTSAELILGSVNIPSVIRRLELAGFALDDREKQALSDFWAREEAAKKKNTETMDELEVVNRETGEETEPRT